MSTRSRDRAALKGAQAVLRGRRDRRGASELGYAIYIAVMLSIIIVAPVVRGAVLALIAQFDSAQSSPMTAGLLAAILLGVTAAVVLGAAHFGPAHARLPEIDLLLTGWLSRARVLGGAAVRVCAGSAVVGASAGAVILAARVLRGEAPPALWLVLLGGGASLGLLAGVLMLLAQLSRGVRTAIFFVLAVLAAWHVCASIIVAPEPFDPWGVVAEAAVTPSSANLPRGYLALVCGLLGAAWIPWLLTRVPFSILREQAARWSSVSGLALTGDLRMAAERLGAPVRFLRRLSWSVPRRSLVAVLVRDLIGLLRTPGRSLAALLGVAAAAAVLVAGASGAATPLGAAVAGAVALMVCYASLGPWCRGLRAAAEAVSGAPLLPYSPTGMLLRHAALPGVLATVGMSVTAVIVGAHFGVGEALMWCCGVVAALAVLLLRMFAAFKGPLPERLLSPIQTPVGDMSGLNVLLWSLDAPLWSGAIGAALAALLVASVPLAAAAAGIVVALLGVAVRARLRMMSSTLQFS